jgi:tRNA (cytidine/uridine-2'-O-)-methyltransferase
MRIALFEPEIAQNTGTILRLGACFHMGVDIIEPCGFIWNHPTFRRSVMDYIDVVDCHRYDSIENFLNRPTKGHTFAVVVGGAQSIYDVTFEPTDTLLFGKESTGLPHSVQSHFQTLHIPMPGAHATHRPPSLNLATAVAIVMGEGVRQAL